MGRRGLGRGLSALIATGESFGGLKFEELPVSAIRTNTFQPRRNFPEASIKELATSIRGVGILQPLVVRSTETGFELIAGERRLRAAKIAGLERVPVLIRQASEDESMELALVENLQRENLNPMETAAAYQALMESFGLSRDQLATRLGKSRTSVTNTLRLAQLPESVRLMLQEGKLTEGHARALLGMKTTSQIENLAQKIQDEKLSVRATEAMVREGATVDVTEKPESRVRSIVPQPEGYDHASRKITESLELPTKVKKARRGGRLEIRFSSDEELEALVQLLCNSN